MLKRLLGQLFGHRYETRRDVVPVEELVRAALAFQQSGRLSEAEAIYRGIGEASAPFPNADIMHLLACNLVCQNRLPEAVALFGQVTSLQPGCMEAYYNFAGALAALGKFDRAVACFNRVLELKPDFVEAISNLGNTLMAAGRLDEAEYSYRRALGLKPDFAIAACNLGHLLHLEGRIEESVECYRRAYTLDPTFVSAHSSCVYALNFVAGIAPREVYAEHLEWARRYAEPLKRCSPVYGNKAAAERRLRIGYVSPNFRDHAAAYFFEPVLECHDAQQFETYCYSDVAQKDDYTARLKQASSEWRDCMQFTDEQLARQILQDRIDILVDLSGHTLGNRLLVFARKPAPIQITWNGYANTTGMSAIDYRITDRFADPPGMTEHLHTEKLLRMPENYLVFRPPAHSPAVNDLPAARSGSVTFGSFNALSKITPQVVHAWSRILTAVPGARLLIATVPAGLTRERLAGMFVAQGIPAARLELHGRVPTYEFLALHQRADIALDPFPFSGTTTTCHSLWMGLPVVTLAGKSHVSRVGVSMLTNAGLTGMIANSVDEYVVIAAGLAGDLESLGTLRRGLRDRTLNSPLTDAFTFTRHLEAGYRRIWTDWCSRHAAIKKDSTP